MLKGRFRGETIGSRSFNVFADSGFMLLAPLNKSLSKKADISLSGTAITLALGLTASHTLVPPTPEPIAAAHYLNADLGLVMLFGIPISIGALSISLIFVKKYVAKTYIDSNSEISEEELAERLNCYWRRIGSSFTCKR